MKYSIIALCFCFIITGCTKNNTTTYKNQGVIIGYDLRMCPSPACGGILITIKNDTATNPPPFYHINATLAQLGFSETTKFPINVNFNYLPDTGRYADYNYIIITQIKVN